MSGISFLSSSQLLSYVTEYANDEQWPQDSIARCEIAKSVAQILEKNSAHLTVTYLPLLEKIVQKSVFTEYPIYKTRVLETYKIQIARYAPPTISVTSFVQLKMAKEFVVAFHASAGNAYYIAHMAQNILQLARDEKFAKARLLLGYFLETAPAEVQKQFFGCFRVNNYPEIRELFFETTYPRVTMLCFANRCEVSPIHDAEDLASCLAWEIFCSELLTSCPNLQTVTIEVQQKGELPEDLFNAIKKSKHLEDLDISNFYISKPYKVLKSLTAHTSLKKLSVQVRCTSQLLHLPNDFFTKIDGLRLRYEPHYKAESPEEDKTDGLLYPTEKRLSTAKAVTEKCSQLTRLRSFLPPKEALESFELVLDAAFESTHHLQTSVAHSLKELSFINSSKKQYSANYVTPMIQQCSTLTSLQAARLIPGDSAWLDAVSKKTTLKELAMQVYFHTKYVELLPRLCSHLSLLHLKLIESSSVIDQPTTLTHDSKLKRLMFEVTISNRQNLCALMIPFLYATNPEELVILGVLPEDTLRISFLDEPERDLFSMFRSLSISERKPKGPLALIVNGEKFSLAPFTRLKRLILCNDTAETAWKFSKEARRYVYETFEVELLGRQLFAHAIDLEY